MDRRLQNLQRFLLEQLHRELSGLQGMAELTFPIRCHATCAKRLHRPASPWPDPAYSPKQTLSDGDPLHDSRSLLLAESERPWSDEASTASTSCVDRMFGMKTVQRTQCLTGAPDERMRHSRTFQVCCSSCLLTLTKPQSRPPGRSQQATVSQVELQYPPASERPAKSSQSDASGVKPCKTRQSGASAVVVLCHSGAGEDCSELKHSLLPYSRGCAPPDDLCRRAGILAAACCRDAGMVQRGTRCGGAVPCTLPKTVLRLLTQAFLCYDRATHSSQPVCAVQAIRSCANHACR